MTSPKPVIPRRTNHSDHSDHSDRTEDRDRGHQAAYRI